MSTDAASIETLVARLHAMRQEEAALMERIARIRSSQLQGELDEIDLRVHLGAMDLRDRLGPAVDALQDRLRQVRGDLADDRATAADVVDALRTAFERAVAEVLAAVDPAGGPDLR